MTLFQNPALYQEPRSQPLKITPPVPRESLLGWLERTGRLRFSADEKLQEEKIGEDLDDILEPDTYAAEEEEEQ